MLLRSEWLKLLGNNLLEVARVRPLGKISIEIDIRSIGLRSRLEPPRLSLLTIRKKLRRVIR